MCAHIYLFSCDGGGSDRLSIIIIRLIAAAARAHTRLINRTAASGDAQCAIYAGAIKHTRSDRQNNF